MVQLGLDVPLFIASLVSMGFGTLSGEFGVWRYLAWKRAAPYWIKVGHSHLTWWSILLVLAALLLPGLALMAWAKTAIVILAFAFPVVWLWAMYSYYQNGAPLISKVLMPVMEAVGFGSLLIVFVTASGVQPPLVSTPAPAILSGLEILSPISVPSEIFFIPSLVAVVGIAAAWVIAFLFDLATPHKPIRPAALVQVHNHTAMIAGSAVIMLMILSVMGVSETVFQVGYLLMAISLPLLTLGLLVFVFLGTRSIVWIAPTGIFYALVVLTFLAVAGVFPTNPLAGGFAAFDGFTALRVGLAVALALILITSALGPYIGLKWDKSPDITVTYTQPEGRPYPGPYPEEYIGTQPVAGTPRGLENAHLSPTSWLHAASSWLLTLILVGNTIFGSVLHMPTLVYLFAVTIPIAPLFNFNGRILAWRNIPYGIGSLYFAGHPIKGFNLVSLFAVALAALYFM